jgi:hypothetical protein
MSDRQAKKLRKLYRKDIAEIKDKVIHDFQFFSQVINPKPKWFPTYLWQKAVRLFINTEKLKEVIRKSANL